MKVRISMPGAAVSVDLEEEKSRKVFNSLARELLIFGSGGAPAKMEVKSSKPAPKQETACRTTSEVEKEETCTNGN